MGECQGLIEHCNHTDTQPGQSKRIRGAATVLGNYRLLIAD